ncbi:MAG: hypothetical protein M2R45_03350 [Verrucomicrobia subdivision 3 bacterium]|nr:hypothetical protein [Limisphaerales bacterium]MCS1416736.1 hypothetical protein [Limisphaerales bacterium]
MVVDYRVAVANGLEDGGGWQVSGFDGVCVAVRSGWLLILPLQLWPKSTMTSLPGFFRIRDTVAPRKVGAGEVAVLGTVAGCAECSKSTVIGFLVSRNWASEYIDPRNDGAVAIAPM